MAPRLLARALPLLALALAAAGPATEGPHEDACSLLQVASRSTFIVESLTIGKDERTVGLKVLRNRATNESVDIAYTFGGKVDSIRLKSPVTHRVRELLVSSGRDAERLLTMGWAANELLLPFANRIANGTYELDGTTYNMRRNKAPNAIHGFLIGKRMQVVAENASAHSASVTLAYEFNEANDPKTQPVGYPFLLRAEVTYALDAQGVSITTTVKNLARQGGPLPFYMGMHPYFVVEDVSKSTVVFDACSAWNEIVVDKDMIPTTATTPFSGFRGEPIGGSRLEPTSWDTGFKATASQAACPELRTEVFDPAQGDSGVLWMKSPEFQWLQVFTGGAPALAQAVAIEPMSGETDAYNNGQAVELLLQAGETWEGTFGFALSAPSDAALGRA